MGCRNQVSKPVNVLIIEDVEDDARSVMESLRNSGFEVTYRCVRDGAEFGMALACEHWDAVIANFEMPGLPGFDALRIFLSTDSDIPFIAQPVAVGGLEFVIKPSIGIADAAMYQAKRRARGVAFYRSTEPAG
jgi:DNA-binding NtrC family response regulator